LPATDADFHFRFWKIVSREGEVHLPALSGTQMNALKTAQAANFSTGPT
jgi:hypothetical protein